MPPLTLEGDTLGQKHRNFNKLVKDAACSSKHLEKISYNDSDVENLMKIDIASQNRNVEYILDVLKCEDMLYVSRAIKQSTWLITDQQYADIMNPQYLETQLFPHMTTKAINKLLLHVKLNLKEEKRVDEFYNYMLERKPKEAARWLQNCSLDTVENVLKKERQFPCYLYKRLCRKSFHLIKYCTIVDYCIAASLEGILFLLSSHTEEFLDYLDTLDKYNLPTIGKNSTEIIMKKCPQRILNKIEKYASSIHLPTLAKYLKKEEIKDFVLKCIKDDDLKFVFRNQDNLKHFVKRIPETDRFEFIKTVFIEKNEAPPVNRFETEVMMCCAEDDFTSSSDNYYRWYQYAPFNIAFTDLKKLIRTESSPSERCAMLIVMANATGRKPQHLQTVLQYYHQKHMNEAFKFKIHFVNNVLSLKPAHEFDSESWRILNQLFHSLEVYTESSNNVQTCLKPIILYNVLHDHQIPEIIEKKFTFDTFKNVKAKLNLEQQSKLFKYLHNNIATKLNMENITNESQFRDHLSALTSALNLLIDWDKDVQDFPILLHKMKNIVKIKKENSFKANLSSLYNLKKSWRRHLFSESLEMCASNETCLNVLKHQPTLLVSHKADLFTLHIKNSIDLCGIFAKLRIYYPHNLAQLWANEYFNHLQDSTGHNAILRGLFTILSQKRIIEIAKEYAPKEIKINWGEVDQNQLNIRKNIAKNLYLSRPSAPLDVVLWYAKGDYLQFTVPSLNAILHNLSRIQSRNYVPKLLEAPVSLQKYGIHLAFDKLASDELRPIFLNIWKTTKNSTIRAILFIHSHSTLCKVKDPAEAKKVWDLMSSFIDNLSVDENKLLYNKIGKVKNIHLSVRGEYYMKCFLFLKSLPNKTNSESILNELIKCAPLVMDLLDPEFVTDKMLENINEQFCTKRDVYFVDTLSSFLLQASSEEEQMKRYEKTLGPLLDHIPKFWTSVLDNEYVVKNNLKSLTKALSWRFRALKLKNKIDFSPIKLFAAIKSKLEEKIPMPENYLLCTYWKLAETYVRLVDEHRYVLDKAKLDKISDNDFTNEWMSSDAEEIWCSMHTEIAPALGRVVLKLLKENIENYFPSIYLVFAEALDDFLSNILNRDTMRCDTLKQMLEDKDFIPGYLLVCDKVPKYTSEQATALQSEIRMILSTHPSMEVQMHYNKVFWNIPIEKKQDNKPRPLLDEDMIQCSESSIKNDSMTNEK